MRKRLPAALDIDLRGGLADAVTPHAGVAPLIDLVRRSGVAAAAGRHLPAKRSPKGLDQGQFVENLVLLSGLGGDCLDDLAHLRRDRGCVPATSPGSAERGRRRGGRYDRHVSSWRRG